MARITKGNLDYIFKILGTALGWNMPDHGGTYVKGAVFIEKWSPGDGVTRYSVTQLTNDAGGEQRLFGPWLGIAEAYAALQAAEDAVSLCHKRPTPKSTRRNPVKKRRGAISRKRKTPRTAAQKRAIKIRTRTPAQNRAIKKLIALNKRRAKGRKSAPKKRPLTPAQKRAIKVRKKARRKSHAYVVKALVGKPPNMHYRWFTGKGFARAADRVDHPPKRYATIAAAKKDMIKIFKRLPAAIAEIKVVKL